VKWAEEGPEGIEEADEAEEANPKTPEEGTRSEVPTLNQSSKPGSPAPGAPEESKASNGVEKATVARSWVKLITTGGDNTSVLS